jgi:glycosyltransferase involved in cell wall biosynthesis
VSDTGANATAPPKPLLVMLAAHEPDRDPRIDWAARTAAEHYDTLILGLREREYPLPADERRDAYRILRLDPQSTPHPLRSLFAEWMRPTLARLARHPLALVVAVIAWAPLFIIENLLRLVVVALVAVLRLASHARQFVAASLTYRMARRVLWLRRFQRSSVRSSPDSGGDWLRFRSLCTYFIQVSGCFRAHLREQPVPPAVVYANDLDTLLAGVITKRLTGCTLIYDAHEFWPYSNPLAPRYQVWFSRAYERWLIRQADHVISVNPYLCRALARTYRIKHVISVPNCEPWVEPKPLTRPSGVEALANGRVRFLFQGNFAPQRGLEEIVDAWQHVNPDAAVLLLRGRDGEDRQRLQERARGLGLENRSVFFLDPVSEAELVGASAEADVGLIPYKPIIPGYTYCCPNKLSQYMHAGLAVASNRLPYVQHVLRRYDCGLVYDSGNAANMVEVFNRLIRDAPARRRMGDNARRSAREEFNWQVQSRPLRELLELVRKGHAAAGSRTRRA